MEIPDTPGKTKKRKQDGVDSTEISCSSKDYICETEDSPNKIAKLVHQLGDHSLETNDSSNDGCSSESPHSSKSDDSQNLTDDSLKNSVREDQRVRRNLAPILDTSFSPQHGAMNSLKEEPGAALNLVENCVFNKLLNAFSQENPPEVIKYNGKKYNLTAAYDEFWKTFYNLTNYSVGHGLKIPRVDLTELELTSVVRILKRGWEDEQYWPKKLAPPFLACCVFGELDTNSTLITAKMFLKFIKPSEKTLIQNQNTVDKKVLDIFRKYCSESTISIGDDVMNSCEKVAHELMVENMKPVIKIWSRELFRLKPISTYDFLKKIAPGYFGRIKEVDLVDHIPPHEHYTAPHKQWNTFFLDWPEDKVYYYFRLLANSTFGSECNICKTSKFNAKHFLSLCKPFLNTLFVDRHDAILKKLLIQLNLALERRGSYFSMSNDWEILTYFRNKPYYWPKEMSILETLKPRLYPHIVAYSMSPVKRALIVEYSISWEYWVEQEKENMTTKYRIVKCLLEKKGFEVELRVFVLGNRGVFIPDLYDLFEEIFGMKHSEIFKVMEEISIETISVAYESKYYKELMETLK